MLGVDERAHAAAALRLRDRVERERRLAARLRTVHLDDATARIAADARREIERERARGDRRNRLERLPRRRAT